MNGSHDLSFTRQIAISVTLGLVFGLLGVIGSAGCGGVPPEARLGAEQLAVGLVRADELVAERTRRRGELARRQVLEEAVAGTITSVEAGLARFDELLGSEADAVAALRSARSALLAVEAALDAWDAGAGEGGFLGAAACAVLALALVAEAFGAAGLSIPSELAEGSALLAGFARGACPAPGGAS